MNLIVNGEAHEHRGHGTIDALLEELGAKKTQTALMVNGKVVSAGKWETSVLNENDNIEMLVFVGGG